MTLLLRKAPMLAVSAASLPIGHFVINDLGIWSQQRAYTEIL